jgi:large subunit ribosomal protein L6
MSRVGKLPVTVPKDVQVNLSDKEIVIKGKLGELKSPITGDVKVVYNKASDSSDEESSDFLKIDPANDSIESRAMWGTTRNIINNMITGVSEGFNIRLVINGVGFRAAADNKILTLSLGFSHDIKYAIPDGITVKCEKPTLVVISGADKQKVGQIAGEIIKYRPVEPYKGKGVYIEGSYIRRKEGKKK